MKTTIKGANGYLEVSKVDGNQLTFDMDYQDGDVISEYPMGTASLDSDIHHINPGDVLESSFDMKYDGIEFSLSNISFIQSKPLVDLTNIIVVTEQNAHDYIDQRRAHNADEKLAVIAILGWEAVGEYENSGSINEHEEYDGTEHHAGEFFFNTKDEQSAFLMGLEATKAYFDFEYLAITDPKEVADFIRESVPSSSKSMKP